MATGATCKFCGRGFRNAQAVRAHLKSCLYYITKPRLRMQESDVQLGHVGAVAPKKSPEGGIKDYLAFQKQLRQAIRGNR